MSKQFPPTRVGCHTLNHRVVLAPMTRLRTIQPGDADLVAFGRHFSSKPDLPYRLKHGLPLAPYVRAAFWGGTGQDHSDFPAYQPGLAEAV